MDAHRIQVFDAADDHDVVRLIAHHLEFKFLPTQQGLFDQDLGDRTGFQTAFADGGVLLRVVCDPSSTTPQGEGRSDDSREAADGGSHSFSFFQGGGDAGWADLHPDAFHRLLEQQTVLRLLDGLEIGSDQLNPVTLESAVFRQGDGKVQSGLPAHGWQQCIRTLPFDHPGDDIRRQWFDVGPIRHLRIGHDRSRIGVHEDHLVPLRPQCFAGLGSGIVEFTGLSDHDRTGAQQKDAPQIGPPRHGQSLQAKP